NNHHHDGGQGGGGGGDDDDDHQLEQEDEGGGEDFDDVATENGGGDPPDAGVDEEEEEEEEQEEEEEEEEEEEVEEEATQQHPHQYGEGNGGGGEGGVYDDDAEAGSGGSSPPQPPPPVAAVYMVDQGGNGQEVLLGMEEGGEDGEGGENGQWPAEQQGELGYNDFNENDPNQENMDMVAAAEQEEEEEEEVEEEEAEEGIVEPNGAVRRWYGGPTAGVSGPLPAETLDHVGDNRIVFVGDFAVLDGRGGPLMCNDRQHSHTVTDRKGWEWRLMIMPNGNSSESYGNLSVFVEHVNKDHLKDQNADFGYPRCWARAVVLDRGGRDVYIRNGHIRISTFIEDVADSKVPLSHNSKKETGMVGLKNQGATCYMNSLLQTLYHVLSLRRAVYDMPTEEENSVTSMALALQRVFYRLQTSNKSVGTKELTKSFGWDAYDSFTQQDVQELNRVLCDHLEDKMKGTPVEGTIQRLFEGTIRSYIQCVDVDFTSARVETYYDIQLDVKGCKDIHESFAKYVEEEVLDGDNKYDAGEQHGRQVAKKGVRFLRFPPVLNVHLKRFEYEMTTGTMVKVNDRFSFPREMDIDQYLGEEAERDPQRPNRYILHSVLVHSGDVHGGHYFAYIRPDGRVKGGQWCKFNDEVVTQVDESEAIEGSYGGGPDVLEERFRDTHTFFPRDVDSDGGGVVGRGWAVGGDNTSAYMLVYVRECDLPKTMLDLTNSEDNGIPQRLRERFVKEEEDQLRRFIEKNEAHLYFTLRV
ncbi:unnamed protein product, partial [Ectocarpus sp. 13 AM-2016]